MSDTVNVLSKKEFKKDYLSYLLGIIVPALINFSLIPFFKHLLGTQHFGVYVYYYSILLIINTSFAGGITQSVIRLHADHTNDKVFFAQSIWLTVVLQVLLFLPVFLYFYWSEGNLVAGLLFAVALMVANLYTTFIAITQASRLSKVSAIAETIRTISLLGLALLLLYVFPSSYFLSSIFFAIICSYLLATVFLLVFNKFTFTFLFAQLSKPSVIAVGRSIGKYGLYLVGWYFFSFGISMANRFVLAHFAGKDSIGNFTASFDLINKGITVVMAPVVVSLFPLMVKANMKGYNEAMAVFIKKITLLELLAMVVALVLFVLVGFRLLSLLINTPTTRQYLLIDVQIIIGSFVWQMAMLQHKFLELGKKTSLMLLYVAIAFGCCVSVDWLLISRYGIMYASTGFMIGGLAYIACIVQYNRTHRLPVTAMPV